MTKLSQLLSALALAGLCAPAAAMAQGAAAIKRAGEPTAAEGIAEFALRVDAKDLNEESRGLLKRNLLDTLGCAIGALGGEPPKAIRRVVEELGGTGKCTLVGGGKSAPDRAALVNGALVRYLDFMDNFAAPGEVCHPADNLAALLAAAEYGGKSGEDLLVALAVAYQVQCRLLESMPTMEAGINHTTAQAFAVAAGASRLLGLDAKQASNAVALAGVDSVSLAVVQAEPVSQWKGLSSGETGAHALQNTFLARAGITGPLGVFEGPLGLAELVHKEPGIDWKQEGLEAITRTSIKKYNAEFQAQAALEATMQLRGENNLTGADIEKVIVDVPRGAYEVIGGGKYGPKDQAIYKEQADHNLRYLAAVALLDGEVTPAQFTSERITRADVQTLLQKVVVQPNTSFTLRLPKEMPARVTIELTGGKQLKKEVAGYEGFYAQPMTWEQVRAKFDRLAAPYADTKLRDEIAAAVSGLEKLPVSDLTKLLARAGDGTERNDPAKTARKGVAAPKRFPAAAGR